MLDPLLFSLCFLASCAPEILEESAAPEVLEESCGHHVDEGERELDTMIVHLCVRNETSQELTSFSMDWYSADHEHFWGSLDEALQPGEQHVQDFSIETSRCDGVFSTYAYAYPPQEPFCALNGGYVLEYACEDTALLEWVFTDETCIFEWAHG